MHPKLGLISYWLLLTKYQLKRAYDPVESDCRVLVDRIYAAKDKKQNNAMLLKAFLEEQM